MRECDTCLTAGDHTPATITAQVEDEGNGWQTWHYCQECADGLGISDGDEVSLEDQADQQDEEEEEDDDDE